MEHKVKYYSKIQLGLAALAVFIVTLACGGSPSGSEAPSGQALESAATASSASVEVVTDEFKVSLDPAQVKAGKVTFQVRNEGKIEHDFAIEGNGVEAKTPMIGPGESATLEVELEPGTYPYVCTVSGHAMLGMRGEFEAVP